MSVSAIGALVWRHPLAEVSMKAAAPIGCVFTFLCLVTGSLWGKPMWGAWWVWDARLTSVLVLLLIYLGIVAIWNAIEDQAHAARVAAIATLVGFVNIPIVKFSVEWWNTLHQGASVFTLEGSKIAPEILLPLLVMACAFTCLYVALHLAAMRNQILRRRLRRLAILAASEAPPRLPIASVEGGSPRMSFLALPHIGFVIAAYAITFVVVTLLIVGIALDHRALRRALAPYESEVGGGSDLDGAIR